MKMTTEKAISILTQMIKFHIGLVDATPTNLEIEEAHYFIKTQLGVAKRFADAVEVDIDDYEINVKSESVVEQAKIHMLFAENKVEITPTISKTHTLYAVPKEKD